MKRKAIAMLLVGGCVSTGLLFAQSTAQTLPRGVMPKDLNDQQDERSVLASAANAALTNGGFDDLTERLTTQDRKRLGDSVNRDVTELNGRIEQIAKIWKEKYGSAFDVNEKVLESFVLIREGEVTDPMLAKANWPVMAVDASDRAGDAIPASGTMEPNYLDKGRNVAVVTLPAGNGFPAFRLSMVHESVDDWRLDIPDRITTDQIYTNLKNRLTYIGENVPSWPKTAEEAHRLVAQNIFAAIYNVSPTDMDKSAGAPTAMKEVRVGQ
jgi:3-oxoacyl-ACP reductase-like protein